MITKEEMTQIINAIYAMTGQKQHSAKETRDRVDQIFKAMDTDGNGELDKDEFIAGAKLDKTIIEAFSLYEGLV